MGDWRTENLENHSGKDVMIIKRDEAYHPKPEL